MTTAMPPMLRQAELTKALASAVAQGTKAPWDVIRYRIFAVRRVQNGEFSTTVDGQERQGFPPRRLGSLISDLREVMYRPGAGTWFEMELVIESSGKVTTRFNYDDEPVQTRPFGPTSYAIDQDAFPRDVEHQPPWLQRMIEEGRRKIAEAANVRFVDGALVLQTTKATGILRDDAIAAGLRDHPGLADLFVDDVAGTDDDFRRWYTAWFPIVYPGTTVTDYQVIPRSVDQITLTGDADTLQRIAKQPW